jgi:phosphotriesterase-related protein
MGLQRHPEACANLSKKTEVNVVMGTGYYVDCSHKLETKTYSIESMSNYMADELRNGFHGFEGKFFPGVVGEMGCSWVKSFFVGSSFLRR